MTPPNPEPGSTQLTEYCKACDGSDADCPEYRSQPHYVVATTRPDELRQAMKNELLDYAHGQVISGTPIEQHLDSIMQLIADHDADIRRSIAAGLPEKYPANSMGLNTAWESGYNTGVAACRAAVLGEEA